MSHLVLRNFQVPEACTDWHVSASILVKLHRHIALIMLQHRHICSMSDFSWWILLVGSIVDSIPEVTTKKGILLPRFHNTFNFPQCGVQRESVEESIRESHPKQVAPHIQT
ncbi:unnamed protein product [Choristocarpus tenellus]